MKLTEQADDLSDMKCTCLKQKTTKTTTTTTHLVWVDDESEVQQVIVVGEVDLTGLWQVELIDVWRTHRQ